MLTYVPCQAKDDLLFAYVGASRMLAFACDARSKNWDSSVASMELQRLYLDAFEQYQFANDALLRHRQEHGC